MITIYIGKPHQELGGEVITVTQEFFAHFCDAVSSPSLFGERKNFIVKNVFEDESLKNIIIDNRALLSQGAHDITIICDKLLAPDTKKLQEYATIISSEKKEKKETSHDSFSLANAFAAGDKKKTWVTFQETIWHDSEIEKIHGMLWWKLKDMIAKKPTPEHHALYQKMARDLVDAYHQSRLGGLGMTQRLEKFFLTLPDFKK